MMFRCRTCAAWQAQILFLEAQVARERQERLAERDEFKRTVDRLLQVRGIPGVGQGPTPPPVPPGVEREVQMRDLMGLFEEREAPPQNQIRVPPGDD